MIPEDVDEMSHDTEADCLCEDKRAAAAALLGGEDEVGTVDDELGEDSCLEEGDDPASVGKDTEADWVCKDRFRLSDDGTDPLAEEDAEDTAVGSNAPFVFVLA